MVQKDADAAGRTPSASTQMIPERGWVPVEPFLFDRCGGNNAVVAMVDVIGLACPARGELRSGPLWDQLLPEERQYDEDQSNACNH